MAGPALHPAVAGTIALSFGAVETFEEWAEELKILPVPNGFLSQCLSTEVENAKVRHKQLPELQEKSLSRLPDLYTADSVPNSQKLNEKSHS